MMGTSFSKVPIVSLSNRSAFTSAESSAVLAVSASQPNAETVSAALQQFIRLECPIVLQAVHCPSDTSLRTVLVRHFTSTFADQTFDKFADVLTFLERLRWKRLHKLVRLTQADFLHTPTTRFSCLPCRINEFVTLAYFDTGCSVSCVTLATARRLKLDRLIDYQLQGVAVGFGSNRRIIGCLQAIPVQVAPKLTLCVDFVVIGQSSTDFLLLGADLMQRVGVCIDYADGEIRFPKQEVPLQSLQFVPNEPLQRTRHLQQFKLRLLAGPDASERLYTNDCSDASSNEEQVGSGAQPWPESRNGNLYVPVQIRQCRLLALIDSGADSSKMSESLAEQLQLLQLVDDRRRRLSHGLGSVISVGRLPPIPIRFEQQKVLYVPFEVLQDRKLHLLLLGSDFFTHYACQVDFGRNCIEIPLQNESSPMRFHLVHQSPKQQRFMKPRSKDSESIESLKTN
jgi:hypothetical protein